jgi:hypothetical protein
VPTYRPLSRKVLVSALKTPGICVCLFGSARFAHADFNATLNSVSGQNVPLEVTLNDSALGIAGEVGYVGQQNYKASNGATFATFCVDIVGNVNVGGTYTFQQASSLSSLPPTINGGNGMGTTVASRISSLYAYALNNNLLSTNVEIASFQVAIWDLIYGSGLSVQDNQGGTIVAGANALLAANYSSTAGVGLLGYELFNLNSNGSTNYNSPAQDQVALETTMKDDGLVAPAPAGLVLVVSGFLPLFAFRRRLRTQLS